MPGEFIVIGVEGAGAVVVLVLEGSDSHSIVE